MHLFRSPPSSLGFFSPVTLLATWFGCGLFRWAPGTLGSLGGLIAGALLLFYGGYWILLAATLVCSIGGIWIAGRYAEAHENKDPGEVVIDEVAGQWIVLLALPAELMIYLPHLALAFILFRLFDIAKPWPVSWADRSFDGGFGIMFDDILAGVFAALILFVIHPYIPEIFP